MGYQIQGMQLVAETCNPFPAVHLVAIDYRSKLTELERAEQEVLWNVGVAQELGGSCGVTTEASNLACQITLLQVAAIHIGQGQQGY